VSKLVLNFKLLRFTTIGHVQNIYVDDFTDFPLQFSVCFLLCYKKLLGKWKNVSNKIPTRDTIYYRNITHVEIIRALLLKHKQVFTDKIKIYHCKTNTFFTSLYRIFKSTELCITCCLESHWNVCIFKLWNMSTYFKHLKVFVILLLRHMNLLYNI